MATISVIVPVYNTELYVNRCIESILCQTFSDFELLLIDDGSIDRSGVICDEYLGRDSRIHVFHQTNQGQAAARNHALDWVFANSDSEYISFIDSDDWVHPRYLELMYNCIKRFDVCICQCGHIETDSIIDYADTYESGYCITPEEQYIQYYSAFMWDKLFSRSCWKEIRFPEGQIYEDVAIWYTILFAQKRIAVIQETLYYYFIRSNSTVNSSWTPKMFARIDAWDAQIRFFRNYGNRNLLQNAIYRCCHIAKIHFDEIEKSNVVNRLIKLKYKIRVWYRMLRMLINYKNEMKRTEIYDYFFSWTFPVISQLYWTGKGIAGKFSK